MYGNISLCMWEWRLKPLINHALRLRHDYNLYLCAAALLLYLFPSLKWHSVVFSEESLCSFRGFLSPSPRQCLKQHQSYYKSFSNHKDLHCAVIFLQVAYQLRSNLLPEA